MIYTGNNFLDNMVAELLFSAFHFGVKHKFPLPFDVHTWCREYSKEISSKNVFKENIFLENKRLVKIILGTTEW